MCRSRATRSAPTLACFAGVATRSLRLLLHAPARALVHRLVHCLAAQGALNAIRKTLSHVNNHNTVLSCAICHDRRVS